MEATKRQQGWKRILNTFLAITLVASTMSFMSVPQQAQAASASPELIVDYEFTDQGSGNILPADKKGNSTLTEVSGTHNNNTYGNTTTAYGSDSTGPYWQWTTNTQRGGGFTLDIDPAKVAEGIDKSYTISVRFSYDMFNSTWTKIIDYKNKTLDTGFYFAGKNKLKFYNIGTDGITSAAPKSIIDIIATRDESTKKFTAYMMVDGVFEKEIEVNDIGGEATPSIVDGKIRFGFFHDDYKSGGLEKTTGGKVYSIKFWDGAITPAEILTATASKGTNPGTTKVDVAPSKSSGTSLKMVVSDKILSFPFPGEAIPTGAQPYTSDADIAGVDATTIKYVGIYEVDDLTGEIVGFRLITLTADQIKADTVYKEPLQAEVDKESTLTEAHYTTSSWNDYQLKLTAAKSVLADVDASQKDVDDALAALTEARGSLVPTTPLIDKTELQKKVNEEGTLTEENYTPASWSKYQEELTKAKAVLTNPTATQEEVNEALTNLSNAIDNLVLVKPKAKTAVLEQTAGANKVTVTFDKNIQLTDLAGFAITVDGTKVVPTDFEIVGDKLVLTFPNNPDVTDKAVKVKYDGTGNLQGTNGAAIEQFELPVEDPYSSAFQITKPDAVTANPQPTIGGKVDVTTTPSTVTIILKNDKDEPLLVDVAATVDPTTGEWTFTPPTDLPDGTYTIIATATNGQQTVTKKHTFAVATTPIVNKVPLQQKVEEGKNLVAGEYTPASWSNYQTALNKAKEILANPNATQEEVDKALAALTGAQNALVKIGKGLGTLTPSTGTLSPSFQTGVTDYTMTVGYSTSVIDFTAIPVEAGATVTTTVNGQLGAIGQIPLQVGENIIVISVKDANGNVRQYTIKVYRDAYTGGGGSWTPNPTPPVTPTPGDTKTKIRVELEIDGEKPLEKTTVEIERTKHANGDITDFVALTEANAKEAVAKAKEIGNNIARIVLPDVNDEVKEAKVEIPKESLKLLRDNGLSLEISSENGHIAIPVSSMEGIDDNFYFRLVPVKKESERQAIEERARVERVVRETLKSNDVHVIARPMTIETNMPSRPVQVTLPLKGVKIPTNTAEREAFLKQLAVFIEHSDGEKKVIIPEVVTMAKGELGLRFTVEKFSTFTIIQVNKKEETKPSLEVKEHEAYIKGFPDGTFGPEKNVTRAQVATMIARILGYTDGPANTAPFKDIPSDHYAAGAIAFVKERGIMNGDVNGNFRASENITRAQMATVVANFKQLPIEEKVAITFNDTKGHWAQWIIEANRTAGIINGRQNGSFAPDEHLTRAQAVVMMNRMFERGPLQGVTTTSFPDVKATHWAFDDIEEAAKSHSYFIDEDGNEQLSK